MRIKTLWLFWPCWSRASPWSRPVAAATTTGARRYRRHDQPTGGGEAAEQTITVNWGTEPPSLDPGLASDTTSANILLNIMDPLVKLDEDLKPVPSLAESFETSEDGKTVTFVLRDDRAWTNGDPVTAEDFEYSWKRTISPELGADYAYQFYGIVGAQEYNGCEKKGLRGARRHGRRQRGRRPDARGHADLAAAVVHRSRWRTTRSSPSTSRRSSSSATSGPRPRTSSPTARSCSTRGSTTPRSTSSRTTTGATPTASR